MVAAARPRHHVPYSKVVDTYDRDCIRCAFSHAAWEQRMDGDVASNPWRPGVRALAITTLTQGGRAPTLGSSSWMRGHRVGSRRSTPASLRRYGARRSISEILA
jgi:hypothetical protein